MAETVTPQPARARRGRPLWLMIPAGVLLLLVVVVPFAFGVWMSTIDLDAFSLRHWVTAPFVGIDNYTEAFRSSGVLGSLGRSVAFAVLTTVFITPIGILAALTVNDRFRGRAVVRVIYLIPYVIPSFVTGTVWRIVLRQDGAADTVLSHLGLGGGNWLIGQRSFWALVGVDTWASWAFIYLLTLAGLQTVPDELYEAAASDGAGWWRRLWHVVLPQLRGPLSLALLLSTLTHFNNFTLPYVLFGLPAPEPVNLLPLNIYQTSFQVFRFGLGAAMSVITMVIFAIPALIYLRAVRLETAEAA